MKDIIISAGPRNNTLVAVVGYVPALLCAWLLGFMLRRMSLVPQRGKLGSGWWPQYMAYFGYFAATIATCAFAPWHVWVCIDVWAAGKWTSFPTGVFIHLILLPGAIGFLKINRSEFMALRRIWQSNE